MHLDAFLADSVASAEGKLYVQGAGWDSIYAQAFPVRHARLGLGLVVRVPYTATNQTHQLEVRLEEEDGQLHPLGDAPPGADSEDGKIYKLGGDFNLGRPPLLKPGDDQAVPIAMNFDGLVFDRPGSFCFVISVDGSEISRLPLRVTQLPSQPQPIIQ